MLVLTVLVSLAALVAGQDLFDTQSFVAFVNGAAANVANVRDTRFAATALLDVDAPVSQKTAFCATAQRALSAGDESLAETLHAVLLATRLACADVKVGEKALAQLTGALTSVKLSELYAALVGLHALKRARIVNDVPAFDGAVKALLLLSSDDGKFRASPSAKEASAFNAGLAFEALALVGDAAHRTAVVVQLGKLLGALETSDGGALSFRDALDESATSLANVRATAAVAHGLVELERAGTKLAALTDEHIAKMALFFTQLKRPRSLAEAASIARGLAASSTRGTQRTPLIVSLVEASRSAITVQVTDVLGRFVADADVTFRALTNAAAPSDDEGAAKPVLVDAKAKALSTTKNTKYTIALSDGTASCGRYKLRVDAKPSGSNAIAADATLAVSLLCKVALHDVQLEQFAAASTAAGGAREALASTDYPTRVAKALSLAAKQTLRVSFAVRDAAAGAGAGKKTKKAIAVAQAFVRLVHDESGRDAVFVARVVDADQGTYAADIFLDVKGTEAVGRQSGQWRVELLVGDSFVAEPIQWHVADVTLSFKGAPTPTPFAAHASLPSIAHKFREPARRPLAVVSLVFAALAVAPLVALLVVFLPRVGANLSGVTRVAGTALVFQALFGAVLVLYTLYFLKLNMLQVLSYLAMLGLPLLVVGRYLLSSIQARRIANE